MAIGDIHQVPVSKWKPNGKHLKCKDCLYGNPNSCPRGIAKLCGEHLGWMSKNMQSKKYYIEMFISTYIKTKEHFDKRTLLEIIDNPEYYEGNPQSPERYYLYCQDCGYIKATEIDHDTIYLDAHCKCGSPVTFDDITLTEINNIKEEDKWSNLMDFDLED